MFRRGVNAEFWLSANKFTKRIECQVCTDFYFFALLSFRSHNKDTRLLNSPCFNLASDTYIYSSIPAVGMLLKIGAHFTHFGTGLGH